MASNKNQHFVPRCFLRPFAVPGSEAINLYNIDRQAFIEKASLKHQCARDYFYGKDERLERAIRFVEDGYCASLREIQTPGFVMTDGHRQVLTHFWLLQHLRTEDVAVRTIEMATATGSMVGASEQHFRLGVREVAQIAMRTFAESMDVVSDMKLCLIRNRTGTPFVASDNPAILTNRWHLQSAKLRGRSFGVPSAGCLFLLPLTPDVLCLGYDGDVYAVPHKNGWVDVRRDEDVAAFNEHQFLNCRANIYVRDSSHAHAVHQAFLHCMSNRPVTRHVIHYAVEDKYDGGYMHYRVTAPPENPAGEHRKALIHSQTVHAKPAEWPRVISWRHKGFGYGNDTGAGYVRRARIKPFSEPPFRKIFTGR